MGKNISKNVDILVGNYERVKGVAKKFKSQNKTLTQQKEYYEGRVANLVLTVAQKQKKIQELSEKVEKLSQVSENDVCQIIHDRDYYQKEVLNWRTAYMGLMKRYIQLEGEYETMEDAHYNRLRRTVGMEEKATKSDMGVVDDDVHDDVHCEHHHQHEHDDDYYHQQDYGQGRGDPFDDYGDDESEYYCASGAGYGCDDYKGAYDPSDEI